MSAALETSALTVATLPLAPAWIRCLASARVSGLRARIATSAPDAANLCAIARPSPLLPPVITALFPSSLMSISNLLPRLRPERRRSRLRGVDPIGQTRGLLDEFERAGEVERVIDRVQVVEVRRLGELDEGQPMPGIIRVQQVAGERQELAAVLGTPVVVECVEFLEPLAWPGGGKGGSAWG